MTTPKIGFACKLSELDTKNQVVSIPEFNSCTTTHAWLARQTTAVAEQRLWDLMVHNINSARNLVAWVGKQNVHLRMVRLSSDLLPLYTHASYRSFWQQSDVKRYAETHFAEVGQIARLAGTRLSFHPGQFCVLASTDPDIVARSIEEFEYHADMARWMDFGRSFQDFKINVHIAGRMGPEGIRAAYSKLSPEARNAITIENEENSWGLDDCLSLSDLLPIVLDIHHNWVREGTYLGPSDARVARVVDSWRGHRPTLHYSISREDVLPGHDTAVVPDYQLLLGSGYKKSKLRAHSDFYWNTAVNDWALGFLPKFDIMCESKAKNLASFKLAQRAQELGLV